MKKAILGTVFGIAFVVGASSFTTGCAAEPEEKVGQAAQPLTIVKVKYEAGANVRARGYHSVVAEFHPPQAAHTRAQFIAKDSGGDETRFDVDIDEANEVVNIPRELVPLLVALSKDQPAAPSSGGIKTASFGAGTLSPLEYPNSNDPCDEQRHSAAVATVNFGIALVSMVGGYLAAAVATGPLAVPIAATAGAGLGAAVAVTFHDMQYQRAKLADCRDS